jgi:ribonucleoside-diphosphate reductase alpha chain
MSFNKVVDLKDFPVFEPTGLGLNIFTERYALHTHETWTMACKRISHAIAIAEEGEASTIYDEKFYEILSKNLFMPGGRIINGAGRSKAQMLNCFVIGTSDSREGWGQSVSDMIVISGTGGGVGLNPSPIRPRGSVIAGVPGAATGAVSLMEIMNAAAGVIKSGGGRRAAFMFPLDIDHGDIQEFLDKKLDLKQLTNCNISVYLNEDPEDFFQKVKEGKDHELKFHGQVVGKIPARVLWNKIIDNMLASGEPGILNGYLANKMSNVSYIAPLVSTNPCQPKGAGVLTYNGFRTFEQINIGDVIWSGKRWTKITNKQSSGIKKTYLYYTECGTYFYGTSNHRIVQHGEKIEVDLAKEIDYCSLPYCESPDVLESNKIVSKIFIAEEEVFNITVDAPEHTYWTGGVLASNCGELHLCENESCCLGSLVLPRFIQNNNINWEALRYTAGITVRFLDNVVSTNLYPLQKIKETTTSLRRVGLGIMGLHDVLLTQGVRYNSAEGLELADKISNFIKNASYEASIELAKEKGSFPKFDTKKYLKTGFVKTLRPSIRAKIEQFGIRNCTLNTIAPTGTTSIVCGVTSGIEPMFAPAYKRRWMDGDNVKSEIVVHPLFKKFIEDGKSVEHFQGSHDLSIKDHLEMQACCQKHVDSAISKTINVLPGVSREEVSELFMEYLPVLKGITVYPEGSRENQPLTPMSLTEAVNHLIEASVGMETVGKCKNGSCDV